MENTNILKLVLNQLPDGLMVFNLMDDIIFANGIAEKAQCIQTKENIEGILSNQHPGYPVNKSVLTFIKNEKIKDFQQMIVDDRNNKVYMNTYKAIRDSYDDVVATIVVTKDITEKKIIEQGQMKRNQLLQEQTYDLMDKLDVLFQSTLICIVNILDFKDSFTKGHSLRVRDLSKSFVKLALGQKHLLKEIEIAGIIHDIGKIGVRKAILNKGETLTPDEYGQMKMHPIFTEEILSPIAELKNVAEIARHHHERYNGEGYPDGLQGEKIPIGARILALTDSFDAMTTARPYRKALTRENALVEIRNNIGSHYDPKLGRKFIDLVDSGAIG
jgi:HD-GYP domain-containing protein (c-di-GMP phosphodiesterase class II)